MENTEGKLKTSAELDLTQFFQWIGRGFDKTGSNFIRSLARLRNLFFRQRLFFLIIMMAGLGFGILYYYIIQKKYYKSTMVLSCSYLNTQITRNIVEKLNLLAPDPKGLMNALKIDLETAKNIQKFEFEAFVSEDEVLEMELLREQLNSLAADKKDVIEKVMTKLMIENKDAYQFTVYVYDPTVVKRLERAFVEYIGQNPYIWSRIEARKLYLEKRRRKLIKDSN